MNGPGKSSLYMGTTAGAIAIVFLFYPWTIYPIGASSNGGALGFGSLIAASGLSWWAFTSNSRSPWLRRLVQLPVTAFVIFMAIYDAYAQWVAGWWRNTAILLLIFAVCLLILAACLLAWRRRSPTR
jgi:hypothetical protein